MKYITLFCILFGLSLSAATFTPPTRTGDTLELSWEHPDPAVTFRLYIGTTSNVYTEVVDVGTLGRSWTLVVDISSDYYIRLTAINSTGLESLPSDELVVRQVDAVQPFPTPPSWISAKRTKKLTVSAEASIEKTN